MKDKTYALSVQGNGPSILFQMLHGWVASKPIPCKKKHHYSATLRSQMPSVPLSNTQHCLAGDLRVLPTPGPAPLLSTKGIWQLGTETSSLAARSFFMKACSRFFRVELLSSHLKFSSSCQTNTSSPPLAEKRAPALVPFGLQHHPRLKKTQRCRGWAVPGAQRS